jgi:hypothetical protein
MRRVLLTEAVGHGLKEAEMLIPWGILETSQMKKEGLPLVR